VRRRCRLVDAFRADDEAKGRGDGQPWRAANARFGGQNVEELDGWSGPGRGAGLPLPNDDAARPRETDAG
jgi:hypothetical protein